MKINEICYRHARAFVFGTKARSALRLLIRGVNNEMTSTPCPRFHQTQSASDPVVDRERKNECIGRRVFVENKTAAIAFASQNDTNRFRQIRGGLCFNALNGFAFRCSFGSRRNEIRFSCARMDVDK
jgi:hypothetical protein